MQCILILSFIFQISFSFSFSTTKAINKIEFSEVKKCLSRHSKTSSLFKINQGQIHFATQLKNKKSDGFELRAGANSNANEIELKNKKKRMQKVVKASLVVIAISIWKNEYFVSLLQSIDVASLKSLMIQKLDELNKLGTGGLVLYALLVRNRTKIESF